MEGMYTGVTPSRLPGEIPAAVKSSPHVSFAVTESLDIYYCNPAWDRFALENGGRPNVLAARVLYQPFLKFVPAGLKTYFTNLFRIVRSTGRLQSQNYECSSPQLFRIYHMQVYPMHPGSGFLVINSLRIEHPHTHQVHAPDDAQYRDKNGLICVCANCRRTRRRYSEEIWDWVPAYVYSPGQDVTHGICPFCREYYYGAYLPQTRRTA
jgi:hypothetical protein